MTNRKALNSETELEQCNTSPYYVLFILAGGQWRSVAQRVAGGTLNLPSAFHPSLPFFGHAVHPFLHRHWQNNPISSDDRSVGELRDAIKKKKEPYRVSL
jgi:hypothetical protein